MVTADDKAFHQRADEKPYVAEAVGEESDQLGGTTHAEKT